MIEYSIDFFHGIHIRVIHKDQNPIFQYFDPLPLISPTYALLGVAELCRGTGVEAPTPLFEIISTI